MITLTRLHGEPIVVNAGLIETVEATPDTLICLANGRKLMVRETVETVITLVTAFYQKVGRVPVAPPTVDADE